MKEEALDGNGREEGDSEAGGGGGGGGAEVLSEEVVAQVLEMFDETYEDAFFKVKKMLNSMRRLSTTFAF